jgi:hypothetical protein
VWEQDIRFCACEPEKCDKPCEVDEVRARQVLEEIEAKWPEEAAAEFPQYCAGCHQIETHCRCDDRYDTQRDREMDPPGTWEE